MLSLLSLLLLGLAIVLVLANHQEVCSRTPPSETDCSTTEVTCILYNENGEEEGDGCIPLPKPKYIIGCFSILHVHQ